MSKYIDKIGYEAEGIYSRESITSVNHDLIDVHNDGSIRMRNDERAKGFICKELVTAPFLADEIDQFFKKCGNFLPNRVNDTCGGHIHISFKSKEIYEKLSTVNFANSLTFFIQSFVMENCGEFTKNALTRVQNGNFYCKIGITQSTIEYQRSSEYKNPIRYHAINFCERLHRTIELRLSPAFSHRQFRLLQRYLHEIVKFVENYCEVNKIEVSA